MWAGVPNFWDAPDIETIRELYGSYEEFPEGARLIVSEPLDDLSNNWFRSGIDPGRSRPQPDQDSFVKTAVRPDHLLKTNRGDRGRTHDLDRYLIIFSPQRQIAFLKIKGWVNLRRLSAEHLKVTHPHRAMKFIFLMR